MTRCGSERDGSFGELGGVQHESWWVFRRTLSIVPVHRHEMVGLVTKTGENVQKFKVGDRVGVGVIVGSCRTCSICEQDLENYCPKLVFTYNALDKDGTKTYGGYSDIIVVDQHFVLRFPDNIPSDSGAPLLCAGITVYSPMKYYGMTDQPGKHLGVAGLGGLGHVAVKFGKAFGLKVTVISRSSEKADEAINKLGADAFIVSSDPAQLKVGGIKPSSGEVVDAVSCGSLKLREPNGSSTGHPDINKGISVVVKSFKPRRNQTKTNTSDSLSDIDDAEVNRYLNTKEETQYKRMLWEAINGKYVNAKKQKKAAERKKGAPLKKAAKITEKVKSPRRSSRINYDALKILNEELEHGSKASQSQIIPSDSRTCRSDDTPSLVMHGSNESNEMSFNEENETSGNHSGDLYGQYGNEHYSGDFHDQCGDEHHSDDFFVFD